MSEYDEQRRDWRKRAGIVAYLIPKNWYMGLVMDDRLCSIPQKVVSRPRWWSLGECSVRSRTGMLTVEMSHLIEIGGRGGGWKERWTREE